MFTWELAKYHEYYFRTGVFDLLGMCSVYVLPMWSLFLYNNDRRRNKRGSKKMEELNERIHVGVNESGEVTCKECIKKADTEEKFMSSTVEGGGTVSCCDCGCDLN